MARSYAELQRLLDQSRNYQARIERIKRDLYIGDLVLLLWGNSEDMDGDFIKLRNPLEGVISDMYEHGFLVARKAPGGTYHMYYMYDDLVQGELIKKID